MATTRLFKLSALQLGKRQDRMLQCLAMMATTLVFLVCTMKMCLRVFVSTALIILCAHRGNTCAHILVCSGGGQKIESVLGPFPPQSPQAPPSLPQLPHFLLFQDVSIARVRGQTQEPPHTNNMDSRHINKDFDVSRTIETIGTI